MMQRPRFDIAQRILVSVSMVAVLLVLFLSPLVYGQLQDSLKVSYIDVGQGDSILLHASDDTDILVDGGPRSAGPTVVAYLLSEGIDDIEVMVLTHGDADHVGGLIDVLRSTIPVESVIYNGRQHTSLTYQEFITETQSRGLTPTPAQAGQIYAWGSITTSVLNPQTQGTLGLDQNDNSVVMLVVYGDMRFLFTGDISSGIEQVIVDTGTLRLWAEADILKVAHHGSRYSSSAPFLEAVGAEVAVISVGASNPYGHPAQETLDRLQAAGAEVLRTDQNGTIVITTDGQTYEIKAGYVVFLPLVIKFVPTPTNTLPPPTNTPIPPTNTPIPPTNTPILPTNTPIPPTNTPVPPTNTPAPPTNTPVPGTTGNVNIIDIFYDGEGSSEPDEYVAIRNDDTQSIQLSGWTLHDEANHTFTFPSHIMTPGQVCRVYTNENHPEWCGFNYGSGSAIWNNSGDCAYLQNSTGAAIDTYCY